MKYIFALIAITVMSIVTSTKSYSQTSWKGVTSVNRATVANWANVVPAATTDAVISDANFTSTFQPAISASSTTKPLTIGGSVASQLTVACTLTVKSNININPNRTVINGSNSVILTSDWINEGNYSTTSHNTTVIFAGINQSVGGSVQTIFRKLTINTGSILSITPKPTKCI